MASALDAVLQLRANEQAQAQQRSDNLTQAVQLLSQAKQQAQANQLAQLQYKAGLAEKGLITDPFTSSGFKRDMSLMSPLDLLLQQGKAADAQKSIVEAGGKNPNIFGNQSSIPSSSPIGKVIAGGNQNTNILVPDKFNSMGVATSYLNPAAEQAKNNIDLEKIKSQEIIKGPAEAAVGKVALANESLKNIDDIKSMLFPDGTSKSFDRKVAFQSNTPHLNLPFGVQVGPSFIPTEKGQDIFRKMGASISGRQLIQTGVAARPEETQKLIDQFAPNFASNPESTLKGLNELQAFYKDYLNNAEPSKRLGNKNVVDESSPFSIGQTYNGEKITGVKRIK